VDNSCLFFGGLRAADAPVLPSQHIFADHQIRKRRELIQTRCVLRQAAIANSAVAELSFDDPERMLHLRAHAGLEVLNSVFNLTPSFCAGLASLRFPNR